ncbi:MAG TPA: superoxide dismutase [Candidatus Limnocylindria bacterium]|nr:superoxide dismutase [Candidatus Limnocylindria bacterium]
MRRFSLLLAVSLFVALPQTAAARQFPGRIDLPDGFAPEGITIGIGSTFFTGSLAGAGIFRGDLRTGEGGILVEGGGPFTGMKVDAFGRLWVAGGPSGLAHVFDARTGDRIGDPLALALATPTFINDVVVTADAAYFTESMQPAIYRVPIGPGGQIGEPEVIALDPADIGFVGGGAFNLNGIDATPDGRTLLTVNSTTGNMLTIDPATNEVETIDLSGGPLTAGDGILLRGWTLYVVRNQLNLVAVADLSPDLSSGTVIDNLTGDTDVPTTIARFGGSLYVVNAAFRAPDVPPATAFWVTRITDSP